MSLFKKNFHQLISFSGYTILIISTILLSFYIVAIHGSPVLAAQGTNDTISSLATTNEKQIIRPWFGIEYLNVTEGIAKAVGLNETKGRLVTEVIAGSPAEKAGVRGGYTLSKAEGQEVRLGGDVILAVDGEDVTDYGTDKSAFLGKEKNIGDTLTLTVFRNGQIIEISMPFLTVPDFFTYLNSTSGITIQYPNDWKRTENSNLVTFLPSSKNNSIKYQALWIMWEDLPRPNMTLDEYTDNTVGLYKRNFRDFKLIGPNPTKMIIADGNNAYKILFTGTLGDIKIKSMEILVIIRDKAYHLVYAAEVNQFSNYLSVIQNMIDSFNLVELTKSKNAHSEIYSSASGTFTNLSSSVSPLADHTFLVYMIGSDLESKSYAATQDILEMMEAGSSPNINILVETGGSDLQTTINENRFIDFTKVQRHKILKNDFQTLSDVGQQNMGDPRILSDFIIWGISEFPAKSYSIIFWDHGSGINGFGKDMRFKKDTLNLDEIEKAFKDAKKVVQSNFELIGFDACLMASIEVANSIKSAGKYMVSSEELEPSWGWNYTTIIGNLNKHALQDGASLGIAIADSFVKHSKTLALSEEFGADKEVTLSVINLAKIPKVIEDLGSLTDYLDNNIINFTSAIGLAHSVDFSERYGQSARGGSGLVDIYDFMSNIQKAFPQSAHLIDAVHRSLKNAILYNVNGEARPNANGLSIYMPLEVEEFSGSSEFSLDSWKKIVNLQYDLINSDKDMPVVDTDIDGETIRGKIYSNDVSSVKLLIYGSMNKGNRVFYQDLEPASFINNDNGSFEYSWKNQILSLCNSKQICSPASMSLEVNMDRKFGFIPVVLKSDVRKSEEFATLIYQINETGGGFNFLGAIPEINLREVIPKEKWALDPKDKIRTLAFTFEDDDTSDLNYAAYPSIQVTDKFELKYAPYNGTFGINFRICDYSNNCWDTEQYRLGGAAEKIEGEPILAEKSSKEEENCPAIKNNFSSYSNDKFGFQIDYPSNWERIEEGLLDPWVVVFLYPPGENWQSVVNIGVENWVDRKSLKEFYEFTAKGFPFSKIVESNETTLAGKIGHKIVFTSRAGQPITDMFVSTVIEGRLYEINFRSNSANFSDEYSNLIQKMIESFVVYAGSKGPIDQTQESSCDLNRQEVVQNGMAPSRGTPLSTNFSLYNSPQFGFRMEYPSNWKVGEELMANRVTFFTPPERNKDLSVLIGDNFTEQIGITQFQANELPPLNEFVNQYINKIKEDHIGFDLIESKPIVFKENPANLIVHTLYDAELRIQIKQLSIIATIGDNTYLLEYFAESSRYEHYLPTVRAMIESIEWQ